MLYSLRGKVVHCDAASIAVECGGVAYDCQTTLSTLSKIGGLQQEVTVYTHMNVRQDAVELFAFADKAERHCFRMLIGVSGVGPKAALAVLSVMTPEQFALAVASGDINTITQAQGVGKKIAQRMVLELKDKVAGGDMAGGSQAEIFSGRLDFGSGNTAEAIAAMVALGYHQSDAAAVVAKIDPALSVEEMIKTALKSLASQL